MDKKGFIKVKERGGEVIVVGVNEKHPDLVSFTPPTRFVSLNSKSSASISTAANSSPSSQNVLDYSKPSGLNGDGVIAVSEMFKVTGAVSDLWKEMNVT
jgi:hypothetical protein